MFWAPEPLAGTTVMLESDIQLFDRHRVAPTLVTIELSLDPKLTPRITTADIPKVGELTTLSLMYGRSKENESNFVPTCCPLVTTSERFVPIPDEARPEICVSEFQKLASMDVLPQRELGDHVVALKPIPKMETSPPEIAGKLIGFPAKLTGLSKLKMFDEDPTKVFTVTNKFLDAPLPAVEWHETLVSDIHRTLELVVSDALILIE